MFVHHVSRKLYPSSLYKKKTRIATTDELIEASQAKEWGFSHPLHTIKGNQVDDPDHIHLESTCTNPKVCSEDHWKGGRPQIDYPHHVEVNLSTGHVAYTRLTTEEISDLKQLYDYLKDNNG